MTIQRTIIGSCLVLLLVFLGRVVLEHKNDKLSADSWQERVKDKLQDNAKDKRRARFNRSRNNQDKNGAYYGYYDIIGRGQKEKKKGGLVERYPASWGGAAPVKSLSWGMTGESSGSSKSNYKVKDRGPAKTNDPKVPPVITGPADPSEPILDNPNPDTPPGMCPNGSYPPCVDIFRPEDDCPGGICITGPIPDPQDDDRCKDGSLPPCDEEKPLPPPESAPVVKCETPSGAYLSVPELTLSSPGANRIRYCVGNASSGQCCNPENSTTYTGAFYPGSTNGQYCVSAVAYKNSLVSAPVNCYYEVDENLVSLTLDMPEKSYFQTQQLNKLITVESDNFRSPAHTFMQVATTTDPGADACEALSYTTEFDEMMTSLGISVVNFGDVEDPFQIPMEFTNKMTYGTNFLISAMERQSPSGSEYKCMKNTIYVEDFHLESQTASAHQATPTDGTYTFQGGLNSYGSFGDDGEAVGSGGNVLEHGFLNIIN